jgi:hypothetical protein
VAVAVAVGDEVAVAVADAVGVPDPVAVGVDVTVEVAVAVGVWLEVEVAVAVAVAVEVAVGVPVAVGVGDPVIPFPDNANLRFPPLLLTIRPLPSKTSPAEVGENTIIMSQILPADKDPSQVSLTSLKGGLTEMLLILIFFFLL